MMTGSTEATICRLWSNYELPRLEKKCQLFTTGRGDAFRVETCRYPIITIHDLDQPVAGEVREGSEEPLTVVKPIGFLSYCRTGK